MKGTTNMLYFKKFANKKVATVHGEIEIDEEGKVKGLTAEQEKEFADTPGFEYEEKKQPAKKQEPKEEESKPAPKKTTARKTTTRKTTTKKDEE